MMPWWAVVLESVSPGHGSVEEKSRAGRSESRLGRYFNSDFRDYEGQTMVWCSNCGDLFRLCLRRNAMEQSQRTDAKR